MGGDGGALTVQEQKRVLFVDDDQNVLDGIQNLLRKQRKVWTMVFAISGERALAELQSAPFDVIVSDMRMPGMDGATLLGKVKETYPRVARIVLSGHAEREAIMRALPVAHQFLSKPCDAEVLRNVIQRACDLQHLFADPSMRDLVGKLDALPSLKGTYLELTDAAAQPDTGTIDISRIIERDTAMSAKVLQIVNSAYFGLRNRLTSVQQAVSYLGIELVKSLALTAKVFSAFDGAGLAYMEGMQQHCLQTATLCRQLFGKREDADTIFTAALLHDVGEMILALGFPQRWEEIVRTTQTSGEPMHVVEQRLLGVSHATIGAYLLGVWGLPTSIVEAAAYHHKPGCAGHKEFDALGAVHIADGLLSPDPRALDLAFVAQLGLSSKLPEWQEAAKKLDA